MRLAYLFSVYSQMRRTGVLVVGAFLVGAIAVTDSLTSLNVSLGILYAFPIVLMSGFLERWQIAAVAGLCAILRETFSPFAWEPYAGTRMANIFLAFLFSGLFVREMNRNRQLAADHLQNLEKEMSLRREAEEQLRLLVESSSAAILVVAPDGTVLLANEAAHKLLGFDGTSLKGEPIRPYLPVLAEALKSERKTHLFRTMVESRGRRRNEETFLAHIWFSTYSTHSGTRLAAVILDASQELRDRQDLQWHSLMTISRVLAGAVSHEVRNLCGAAAVAHANLARLPELRSSEDLQALGSLIQGLNKIASSDLRLTPLEEDARADLSIVLDELRVIVEPMLEESNIQVKWDIGAELPQVCGDQHSLLQVFLNLVRNSQWALEEAPKKSLTVCAFREGSRVLVRFADTGPGVASPERLFQPFQTRAEASGLGLYVARAIMRSFAGDVVHEPQAQGSCFTVQLATVASRAAA